MPPAGVELYCRIHQSCYLWFATSPGTAWTATDVTRLAINLYLVAAGVRRGCLAAGVGGDLSLVPAGFHASPGPGPASAYIARARGQGAAPAGSDLGFLYPDLKAHETKGSLTWICNAGAGDIRLWSEPIGESADLAVIVDRMLKGIQEAVRPLGYTAHVRIE